MKTLVRLADLNILISGLSIAGAQFFSRYSISKGEPFVPDMHVDISSEDIEAEMHQCAETRLKPMNENRKDESFKQECETLAVCRKISNKLCFEEGFLMHGSAFSYDGCGVMIIAPSGTGKSTHSRMWREVYGEHVKMINDDKPFIRFDNKGVPFVYGTPWSGKHRLDSNTKAPLKAICVIEQAETDLIKPLELSDSLTCLIRQIHRPRKSIELVKTLHLTEKLGRCVKLYKLSCTPTHKAAKIANAKIFREDS